MARPQSGKGHEAVAILDGSGGVVRFVRYDFEANAGSVRDETDTVVPLPSSFQFGERGTSPPQ